MVPCNSMWVPKQLMCTSLNFFKTLNETRKEKKRIEAVLTGFHVRVDACKHILISAKYLEKFMFEKTNNKARPRSAYILRISRLVTKNGTAEIERGVV